MARGLENCKCAINICAKICLGLLNGWNVMLLKVGAPADDKAVEDAHVPSLVDQTIDKVTSNKARAASYQIHSLPADRPMLASSTPTY
jgi:hypothetical protein